MVVAWWRPVVALFVAGLFVPTAFGTGPVQDDAGYGIDAPGTGRAALPVELGTITGNLERGSDGADAYRFEVPEDQVLTVASELGAPGSVQLTLYGPDEDPEDPTFPHVEVAKIWAGSTTPIYAFTGGTWVVTVSYSVFDSGTLFSQTPYELTLTATPDPDAVGIESRADLSSAELALPEGTSGTLLVHLTSAGTFTDPDAAGFLIEFGAGLRDVYGTHAGVAVSQGGNSGTVAVQDGELPDVAGPEPVHHPNLIVDEGLAWSTWVFRLPDVGGDVRISNFMEGNDHVFHVSLVPDGPVEAAFWQGSDLLQFQTQDLAESYTMTPAGASFDDYTLSLDVQGRLYGLATGGFGTTMELTAPDGDSTTTSWLRTVANLEPGAWTIDYEGYEQNGLAGHRHNSFVGGFYPDLGLFDDPGVQVPVF